MKTHVYLTLCAVAASTALAADCDRMCTQEIAPVCGSDGKTYNNKCVFEIAKCKAGDATLTIAKDGECSTSGGSSSSGTPECSKEFACLDVYKPVCASNGVTYSNDCMLKKAQCVDKSVLKKSDGACDKSETSTTPPLPTTTPGTSTTSPSTQPTTAPSSQSGSTGGSDVCSKACTKEIAYVCGSDGKTYNNECLLEQEKECKTPMLTKASDGACGGGSAATSPNANTAPSTSTPQPNGVSGPSPLWAVAFSAVIGWGIAGLF